MTSATQKTFPVSWEELHRNAKALAWRLIELGPWKGMVAVTRGGMVPAVVMARELEILVIETISVVSYDPVGKQSGQSEAKVLKYPANIGDGEGWLVVDDMVDSGRTMEVVRRLMPKAHFAAVYAKPLGKPFVDSYATELSQDTWLYWPWDVELQFVNPIATQKNNK